jgi:two-component system chemotaxis response regulator CheB
MQVLVSELPANLPASILVVVHTSPQQQSHLADVLNRNGNMRVVTALNGSIIMPRHIYIAPPDHHLTVSDGRTWLSIGPKVNRHRPAIDPLFESAAQEYGSRVVGVVLTGYLDDGSAGLATIKHRGGTAIVQDPKDAFAPDMPRNALQVIKPDYRLPVAEIPRVLTRLVAGRNNNVRGKS